MNPSSMRCLALGKSPTISISIDDQICFRRFMFCERFYVRPPVGKINHAITRCDWFLTYSPRHMLYEPSLQIALTPLVFRVSRAILQLSLSAPRLAFLYNSAHYQTSRVVLRLKFPKKKFVNILTESFLCPLENREESRIDWNRNKAMKNFFFESHIRHGFWSKRQSYHRIIIPAKTTTWNHDSKLIENDFFHHFTLHFLF